MADGTQDGSIALRLVTDHIQDCTTARISTANAIGEVKNLIMRMIWGLIAGAVAFGAFYFVQATTLANQLTLARAQQAAAISQIPDVTASKVAAKVAPPQTSESQQ